MQMNITELVRHFEGVGYASALTLLLGCADERVDVKKGPYSIRFDDSMIRELGIQNVLIPVKAYRDSTGTLSGDVTEIDGKPAVLIAELAVQSDGRVVGAYGRFNDEGKLVLDSLKIIGKNGVPDTYDRERLANSSMTRQFGKSIAKALVDSGYVSH